MIDFHWDDIEALNETQPQLALLAAIGAIAETWATLELTIDAKAISLAKLDRNLALCITSQIAGHGRKLDALIAIAKLTHAEIDEKALNKLAQEAMRLSKLRNRIVHDVWHATMDGTKKRFEITAEKKLTFATKPTELKELRDIWEQIWNLREQLIGILRRAKPVEPKTP